MLAFRYPNGKRFIPSGTKPSKSLTGTSPQFGNRGMTLEEDLNETNEYYLQTGQAVIHKKPTPVQIVGVDYPKRSAATITEAYFKQPSTTDYNGVYSGKYIDFEAKETRNKTSFPFGNVHEHQVKHMERVVNQGGIAFLIFRFSPTQEVYLYDASHFIYWFREQKERKSIPKNDIEEKGHLVPQGLSPRLDYLQIIDRVYF